ncbi:nuclear transport factor 2 family protein [Mitsuaria sp. GD03876]|uniref:nuclear transport factor 2 family protein n=1 Tax=Mitsuaria sp. GD03876 TaxID=2975399 RepID=UPI0024471E78|nr:nuclear transport factor 2 family protein [Mitsuaria sp. GD03876]MDH0866691.1 nuclear transport factor 2 family protein [Mitsuaria sp. GD03876]
MPERNKDVLKAANAAIERGDHEGFLAHCAEDIVWTTVGQDTLVGKETVRQWMKTAYREPPSFTVSDLVADGDFVIALGTIDMAGDDDEAVVYAYCDVWRFRDGKMAELRAFVIPE